MKLNSLFNGAIVLGMLLEVGCGGTIDLNKLKPSEGAGSTSSSGPGGSGGLPEGASAGGGAGNHENGISGDGGGGYANNGGGGAWNGGQGGGGGVADPVCTVDEDCVECVWQKDAEKDGCNMTCCETTALSIAACEHNYQSFMDTCNRGPCDIALCAAPPKPACLNGQCVHVN